MAGFLLLPPDQPKGVRTRFVKGNFGGHVQNKPTVLLEDLPPHICNDAVLIWFDGQGGSDPELKHPIGFL